MLEVPLTELDVERFDLVLDESARLAFRQTVERGRALFQGRTLWSVNSTASGGGVAEMLRSLMGYVRGAGIDGRWVVIDGDEAFFRVTKRMHNRLHGTAGDGGPLGPAEVEVYRNRCESNALALAGLLGPDDLVLLHDPQTAGMVASLASLGVGVVWRAHIGLDVANALAREAWELLRPFVEPAHCCVFSREAFAWEGLARASVRVIAPSVDAFSPKNQPLGFTQIAGILAASGLSPGNEPSGAVYSRLDGTAAVVRRSARLIEEEPVPPFAPLVTQVSRWDRLKDPVGLLSVFAEHLADAREAHLVLAGPDSGAVADDPEAAQVLEEVMEARERLPTPVRHRTHLALLPMEDVDENAAIVNALQRRSDVVVQNSLAEGFGLTVAEAMWKGRPTVASRVGGIQDQIEDGRSGFLFEPGDQAALGQRVGSLLRDPALATRVGMAAHMRVRDGFLGPRHLTQWLDVFQHVDQLREGSVGVSGQR